MRARHACAAVDAADFGGLRTRSGRFAASSAGTADLLRGGNAVGIDPGIYADAGQ